MAKFNYFRIFLAILATFGGFFAYVCRYNLSLVIHEMATSEPLVPALSSSARPSNLTDDLKQRASSSQMSSGQPNPALANLRLEEQTLAALAAGRPWWIHKASSAQLALVVAPRERPNNNVTLLGRVERMRPGGDSLEARSIDFNVTTKRRIKKRDTAANGDQQQQQQQATFVRRLLNPLPKVNWSEEGQNSILSAFFLGYFIFQIPAARAAELYGAKTLILLSGFGTGLTSILFVLSARLLGDALWCAWLVRFLMGALQAGLFPAVYVLFCVWLPKSERSYLLPVPSAMGRLGTIAVNLFAPLLVRHHGWPMVFVVSGCVVLAWALLFLLFASSSPRQSRWLSSAELLHIEARMEPRASPPTRAASLEGNFTHLDLAIGEKGARAAEEKPALDWLKVARNRPIALLALVMSSADWTNMLLLVKLPGFLGPALGMELEEIGFWTVCLVAVFCLGYPLSGALSSRLHQLEWARLSSLNIRKLFETLAHALQALGCLLIALCNCQRNLTLAALFLIMLARSLVGGGQCLMPPELSREFPGTVMAYANAISSLASFFGPNLVSWLVEEPSVRDSWRPLWLTSAALYFICGLLFLLLADNSPQDLARRPGRDQKTTAAGRRVQLELAPYLPPPYAQRDEDAAGQPTGARTFETSTFETVSSDPAPSTSSGRRDRRKWASRRQVGGE